MDSIYVKAYAKINLTLDITKRHVNGYHEVEMIMQKISLYDDVYIEKNNSGRITLFSNRSDIPNNENNIAYKAAEIIRDKFGINDGIYINIIKRIPVAAGLAGGSADCAAVLTGLNKLFELNISDDKLMDMGCEIGKDVPFCIAENATMFAYGFGEKLKPVGDFPRYNLVLAKPDINVSTAWAYKMFDSLKTTMHPDTEGMLGAIKKGDRSEIEDKLFNVFEYVTAREYPIIDEYKDFLIKNGSLSAIMSGSGPSVFGLFSNKDDADTAAEKLKKFFGIKEVFSTVTL